MLGAIVRAATTFAAGMLIASILKALLDPLIPLLKNGVAGTGGLGSNSVLVQTLETASSEFVLFVLLSVLIGLIVRALVERQLGAAGGRL